MRQGTILKKTLSVVLLVMGLAIAPAVANPTHAEAAACGDVLIIGARGTFEPAGFGATVGPIVSGTMNGLNQYRAAAVPLNYPASGLYDASKAAGVTALTNYMTNIIRSCPQLKFVLIGHSQGADVVGDVVQSGRFNSKIIGVAMTGDPRFRAAGSGNFTIAVPQGTIVQGRLNGAFGPRPAWSSTMIGKVLDVCQGVDTVCASPVGAVGVVGAIGGTPHNSYMKQPITGFTSITSFLGAAMHNLAKPYAA